MKSKGWDLYSRGNGGAPVELTEGRLQGDWASAQTWPSGKGLALNIHSGTTTSPKNPSKQGGGNKQLLRPLFTWMTSLDFPCLCTF